MNSMNPAKIDYAKYFFDRTLIRMAVRLSIILVFLLGVFAGLNYVFKTADEKIYIIYLRGLISNPEALYQASLEYEKKNRYSKAIADMKLAIGVLERHSAAGSKLECYRKRLAFLEQERLLYESF